MVIFSLLPIQPPARNLTSPGVSPYPSPNAEGIITYCKVDFDFSLRIIYFLIGDFTKSNFLTVAGKIYFRPSISFLDCLSRVRKRIGYFE